jgi:DNA-directed RNA polymerase subunit L
MSNIKKVLDDVKAGLQVEKPKIIKPAVAENEKIINIEEEKQQPPTKKKKELSDKQKEALKQGQLKRMEILRLKKEEIRQAKLSKGESTEYNKPDSLKNKLKNLDKIDELIKKLSVLEESKKTPINMNEKEITKQKEIILEEDKQKDEVSIEPSHTTLENCYDIILENEDYTIGNILNYEIYSVFYMDLKHLTYVGFKKLHPHDNHSILRMAFSRQEDGKSAVKVILIQTIKKIITNIKKVHSWFDDKIRK